MWGAPSSWRQLDTERARGRKSHLFDDTGQWWLGQTGVWRLRGTGGELRTRHSRTPATGRAATSQKAPVYAPWSNMEPTRGMSRPVTSDQPEMLKPARKPVLAAG